MVFLYKLFVRFIYADDRMERSYGHWYTSSIFSIFAANLASACGMYHSFTSLGLILFFNLADGNVRNVIDQFQADQFICDCLHSPARSPFRRQFSCTFHPRASSISSMTNRCAMPTIMVWEAPYASIVTNQMQCQMILLFKNFPLGQRYHKKAF